MIRERLTQLGDIELRANGDSVVAVGYASVFNLLSQNLGGFVEQVAPGAFAKTLQEQDVRALFNHDESMVLGRLGAGTVRIEEDGTGLRFEIDLPDTTIGRDLAVSLRRRDVIGASFGFRTIEDDWSETPQGFPLRTLKQVALRDVGPVTFPAYEGTEAALRSLAAAKAVEFAEVRKLADSGDLRSLFRNQAPCGGDGRETRTVARQRIAWLHA